MQVLELSDWAARTHKGGMPTRRFRNPATINEMDAHCSKHSHILLSGYANNKVFVTVKVNGKVRRWKKDPKRIAVPIKYGMYQYGTLDASDIGRVLIPIEACKGEDCLGCPVCDPKGRT